MNWSIFGYMSSGEMVPDVMTTLLNRSKTGLIAIDGSKQLPIRISEWKFIDLPPVGTHVKWKIGFGTVALSVSNGSRMSRKPMAEG